MAQKVRLIAYRGERALQRVEYVQVFENMAAACAFYGLVKAACPGCNMAFEGLEFEAAMAEMVERLAA